MLCRCASPGGESSACIACAWSRVSRVPVSAGRPVPSPCQAAAAAPQKIVAERRRAIRMMHVADPSRRHSRQAAGAAAARRGQQHGAAARRSSAAACRRSRGGRTLWLLVVCAMRLVVCAMRARYGYGYGAGYSYSCTDCSFFSRLLVLIPGRPARRSPPTSAFARLALHTAIMLIDYKTCRAARSCFSAVVRRGADIFVAAMCILMPIAPQYRAMALTSLSLSVRADSTDIWRLGPQRIAATQRRRPDGTQSNALHSVRQV